MIEEWRDVKGWEGLYQVSSMGRVRSIDRMVAHRDGKKQFYKGAPKKLRLHKTGYILVFLHRGGKKGENKMYRVHRLVAEAFVPNPEGKKVVNHKNFNRTDNRAINLEWCTTKENIIHRFKEGDKKTSNVVVKCIERNIIYESGREAAKACGLSSCSHILEATKSGGVSGGFHWERL